jgi:hypothetical protein
MASFYQRSREATDEALRLFYAAIGRDAEFASAYGMAAWCYGWRKDRNAPGRCCRKSPRHSADTQQSTGESIF